MVPPLPLVPPVVLPRPLDELPEEEPEDLFSRVVIREERDPISSSRSVITALRLSISARSRSA